ncbi:MAG: helix-turn-helix domain-containing protein [Cohaesibacter sp.]|jgi:AraC-like DNA-binding protein|nr:helix-turn-helix domain-containing protein [Cohaesibacter sp.]
MDASTLIPTSVFSVDDVAQHERYEVWRDSISCVFDVETDREIRQENFGARVEAQICGQLMLASTTTLKQKWERSSSTIARCGVDHYMVQFFESGYMAYEKNGQEYVLRQGDVIIFDLAEKAFSTTNNFSNFSIIVPRALLAPHLVESNAHHLRILSRSDPLVAMLHDHMVSLRKFANQVYVSQTESLNSATIALLAAAMNGTAHDGPIDREGKPIAKSIMVKRAIDDHLSDPDLQPEKLAVMLGMSRSKLYSMFATYGGVKSFVRERRLSKAMHMLTAHTHRHRSIAEIAFTLGFANESTFRRNFKARFGIQPREARQHRLDHDLAQSSHRHLDRRYENWLRDLSL